MQADEVLQLLNNYGKYPKIIYFLLCFVVLRGVFSVFSIMYIAPTTAHMCKSDRWISSSNISVVTSDCYVYVYNGTNNVTRECTEWSYDKSPEQSIIAQWNLVCNEDFVHISTAIYMVGNLFGCIFLMPFADKFGRKLILNILLSVQLILNLALVFSDSIIMFTILRFFIGASNITIALITYCMLSEVLPSTRRTLHVIGASSFWSFGIMFLALFGYFIPNWKILQFVLLLPNLVVIFLCWLLPESISWLFTHKKFERIIEILNSAAKWDKKTLPGDFNLDKLKNSQTDEIPLNYIKRENNFPSNSTQETSYEDKNFQTKNNSIKDSQEQPTESTEKTFIKTVNGKRNIAKNDSLQYTELVPQTTVNKDSELATLNIKSLFSTSRMLGNTLIMFYISTVNSLGYFGIILSTPSLPGNLSLNLFWTAICEIFAYIVTMLISNKVGCRYPMTAMMLIAGFSNFVAYFLITFYTFKTTLVYILTIFCTMIGRFGMSGSYSILYLLFTELFPTAIRNQAMGFTSFFENLGGIFAPIILLTTKEVPFVILIIFGVLNVIGAILVLLLPETHLKALPESVEQIESWSKKTFYQISDPPCKVENCE